MEILLDGNNLEKFHNFYIENSMCFCFVIQFLVPKCMLMYEKRVTFYRSSACIQKLTRLGASGNEI